MTSVWPCPLASISKLYFHHKLVVFALLTYHTKIGTWMYHHETTFCILSWPLYDIDLWPISGMAGGILSELYLQFLCCFLSRPYCCPCPGASCKWQGSLEQVMGHLMQQHKSITTLQGNYPPQLPFPCLYHKSRVTNPLQFPIINSTLLQMYLPIFGFLGHLSHSGDLLLCFGVRRGASFVGVLLRALTSSSQELLGQSSPNLVCSICRVRRQEIVNFMTPPPPKGEVILE